MARLTLIAIIGVALVTAFVMSRAVKARLLLSLLVEPVVTFCAFDFIIFHITLITAIDTFVTVATLSFRVVEIFLVCSTSVAHVSAFNDLWHSWVLLGLNAEEKGLLNIDTRRASREDLIAGRTLTVFR